MHSAGAAAACCLEAILNQFHKAAAAAPTDLSAQTNSAGGVVGVDGDTLFLVRSCVVWLPVVDKQAVLRDEALDHLWERQQTNDQNGVMCFYGEEVVLYSLRCCTTVACRASLP